MKILLILAKTFSRSALFHMKTTVTLKYFMNKCLWKYAFAFISPQAPPNLISLTILVDPRSFAQIQPKIRAIKLKRVLKFGTFGNCFSVLVNEVLVCY